MCYNKDGDLMKQIIVFILSILGIINYYLDNNILLYICGSILTINNIIKYFYSIFKGKIIITLRPIFYSLIGIAFYQNILLGILCGTCICELIDIIINLFIKFMKKFQK